MPKVKKTSSYIHPNSRKAAQLSRQEHRNLKMEKRKEELTLKQKAKLKKLKWFKDNIDIEKEVYTLEEIRELIERYLQRFKEVEQKAEELKSIKGRHNQDRMSYDYKMKFLVDKERQDFETSGLEVPNLMKQESFSFFKKWDEDVRHLTNIDMTTVLKNSNKCK